jgi:tetratricopeptide (TPR) repeat protein
MRKHEPQHLSALEKVFAGWCACAVLHGETDFMRRFLDARFAKCKKDWLAAKNGFSAAIEKSNVVLEVGRAAMPVHFGASAASQIASILADIEGDADAAIESLTRYLERIPNNLWCRNYRAQLLHNRERYGDAVSEFEWIMQYQFGFAPSQLGEFARAVEQAYIFAQGVRIGVMGSDNPMVESTARYEYDRKSMAYFANSLRHISRFQDAAMVASAILPDHDWATIGFRIRGAVRLVIEPSRALEDLNVAIERDPANTYARLVRAYLHRMSGRFADAFMDVERILKATPNDTDTLHLSLEMMMVTEPLESLATRIEELGSLGVTDDVLRFAEICASRVWSTEEITKFDEAVRSAYGDLLSKPAELNAEGIAHLVAYAVIVPEIGDPTSLIDVALNGHCLANLVETTLPLCIRLREINPEARPRAEMAIAHIRRAIARAAGRDSYQEIELGATPRYPPKDSYPFPMYCELSMIGGLEAQLQACNEILAKHSQPGIRTLAVLRLDDDERVYVQCNFKNDSAAEFKYKFCDEIRTTLGNNLRTLVVDFGVSVFLFTDETLLSEFDSTLRRASLSAVTRLVGVS